MKKKTQHICVCICTFKRPVLLRRLLESLRHQVTKGLFTYSIVVADNDCNESAKSIVAEFSDRSMPITYCVEVEQNIALVRNKAIEHSDGNFIAFIDDDEVPDKDWLYNHLDCCTAFKADGVLGPVMPYFEHDAPKWIIKGKFFERPTHDTGYKLDWTETRTGNLLFRKEILDRGTDIFKAEFGSGSEDVDFFRRMIAKDNLFIWCNNAVVRELVPPGRCSRAYLLRLGLLRGGNSFKHKDGLARNLLKSIIALPLYTAALPFLFIAGHHHFMNYLVKCSDHAGRLLSLLGINPVKSRNF